MLSRPRLFVRPSHTALAIVPILLLSSAVVLDAMNRHQRNWLCAEGAYRAMTIGLLTSLLILPLALLDRRAGISSLHARTSRLYGLAAVATIACFAASLLARLADPADPDATATLLSFIGGAGVLATAWLRDELTAAQAPA